MQLTVNQLSKTIAGASVLRNVNFTWQPGEIVGLVGRNGAGKTSLMRTMMNQYLPDAGSVAIDGLTFAEQPAARQQLIYIDPANLFFKRYSLRHIADFYAIGYPDFDRARYEALLVDNDLAPTQQFRALSKGYQAVVVLALTLASNAPFMMLDEPFDGLDLFVRETIVKLVIAEIAGGQRGFLIASHNLNELDGLADRILFLKHATIDQTITLEDYREHAVKLQLVFPGKSLPPIVHEAGQILTISGRVATVVFPDYTPAVQGAIEAAHPVLNEALPLTLTDLFRHEFAKEDGQ